MTNVDISFLEDDNSVKELINIYTKIIFELYNPDQYNVYLDNDDWPLFSYALPLIQKIEKSRFIQRIVTDEDIIKDGDDVSAHFLIGLHEEIVYLANEDVNVYNKYREQIKATIKQTGYMLLFYELDLLINKIKVRFGY